METLVTRKYPNVDLTVYEEMRLHNTELHFRSADAIRDYRRVLNTDLLIADHRETAFWTDLAAHEPTVANLPKLTLN